MPTIESFDAARRLSRPAASPRAAQSPDPVAQALQEQGRAMSAEATAMDAMERAEARTEADLKFSRFQGAMQQRFTEAQENAERGAPGFADRVMGDFDKQASEFMNSVPRLERGRMAVNLQNFRNRAQAQSQGFEVNQRALKISDDIDDAVTAQQNFVAGNPEALETALPLLDEMIEESGLRPEAKDERQEDMRSRLFGSFAGSMVRVDPETFVAELRDGRYDDLAQGDQKARAIQQAEREIERREREAERAQREAQAVERAEVAALVAAEEAAIAAGQGSQGLVSPERVEAAYQGERGRRLAEKLRLKQEVADKAQEIALLPAEDIPAWLEGLPEPSGEDFDIEAEALNIALTALSRRQTALAEDPALYALTNSEAVRQAFSATEGLSGNEAVAATEAAVELLQETQVSLLGSELGLRVTTKPQALSLVQDIAARMPREQGAAVFAPLERYGRFAPQLLGELRKAGLSDSLVVASSVFESGDQVSAAQLARAAELGDKKQKDLLGAAANDIETEVLSAAADITAVFGNAGLGEEVALRIEGAQALARQKMIEGETSASAAARKAVEATLPFEPFTDTLAIPRGTDPLIVRRRLAGRQAAVVAEEIDLEAAAIATGLPLDDAELAEQYADSVRGNGFWRNSSNGAILLDPDGRPVPLKGKRFVIETWDDMADVTPEEQRESTIEERRRLFERQTGSGLREVED